MVSADPASQPASQPAQYPVLKSNLVNFLLPHSFFTAPSLAKDSRKEKGVLFSVKRDWMRKETVKVIPYDSEHVKLYVLHSLAMMSLYNTKG